MAAGSGNLARAPTLLHEFDEVGPTLELQPMQGVRGRYQRSAAPEHGVADLDEPQTGPGLPRCDRKPQVLP